MAVFRRRNPANGTSSRHNATAQGALLWRSIADEMLVWMDSETVVVPAPAAIMLGVKVAVAPEGSPLAEKVIAVGNVVAPVGAIVRV
jgi:hypothetical protein